VGSIKCVLFAAIKTQYLAVEWKYFALCTNDKGDGLSEKYVRCEFDQARAFSSYEV